MASPVAVLDILVRANTGAASAQLTTLDRQLKGTAATANTTSAALGARLAKAAKYGALGLAGIGAVSVKMAVDFDKSMRNVNSIAQLNEKQFRKLGDEVKALAGKTAQSPKTLAEGLYDLVSSGFDATESMKVLKASANAATAGLTDTATSTKAVSAVLNAYRMPAAKAGKVSDVLFRTVDRGVISFEELAGTIGNVLPAATTLGVKLPEVGAAISTLTKEGQSGATAVTNINAAMTALFKPSEAMKDALADVGYESAQSLVKAKGFEGALKLLIGATDGSAEALGELFTNVRAQRAVFGLTGRNAGDAAADLRGLEDSAGATQRALDEQTKSVAFMWQQLKAKASALAIDIGDSIIPAIKDMLTILNNPKLTLDEKISKLGVRLTKMVEQWAPKVAEAGGKIGLAIVKGIWGAFWNSDLLGKLFIGAAALRLFGGAGVFGKLGVTIATKIGLGMKGRLGGMGSILAGGLVASITFVIDQKMQEIRQGGTKLDLTAKKLVAIWDRYHDKVVDITGGLKDRFGSLTAAVGAMSEKQQKAYRKAALIAVRNGDITINEWQAMTRVLDNVENRQRRMWERAAKVTGQKTSEIKKDVGDMTVKVSGSYDNMVEVTGSGINWLMKNTSSAMKALGLKQELNWSLQRHNTGPTGGGYGNQSRQRGGQIYSVPGTGTGDKVPAMLEPGEVVVNRKAVAVMGGARNVNRINDLIPRFQDGGKVRKFARGGMVTGDTDYSPELGRALEAMASATHHSIYVQSGGRTMAEQAALYQAYLNGTGNLAAPPNANAPHVRGIAADITPGQSVFGGVAGRYGLGFPIPGESWHIQLMDPSAVKGRGGAVPHLARVTIKGPNGPLRQTGQAALDTVLKSARKFLASKMPTGGGGGYTAVESGGSVVRQMGQILLGNKFTRQGAAGIIGNAYRESLWDPSSVGTGGGGLFGFTTSPVSLSDLQSFANRKGKPWTDVATQMEFMLANPGGGGLMTEGYYNDLESFLKSTSSVHDATFRFMDEWERPGIPAFEDRLAGAQRSLSMFQRGGILKLAKGGEADKGGKPAHGTATPGPVTNAYKRFRKARQVAKQIKELLGERGRVARVDERIANAEALAGLASSEAGSEMSPKELARQIRLNELLLANLVKARKLARTGLGFAKWPRGMSVDKRTEKQMKGLAGGFQSNLIDLAGLTGSGGRIAATKNTIDELKHTTSTSGPELLDISGLRAMLEAARYGVFDGYYAKGGTIGRGKWGVVGENGPEIVHGPATVTPSPQVTVENNFDWEGMDLYVTTTVDGQIAKREKLSRRRARQMVR